MTLAQEMASSFGTDNFAQFEQEEYARHQDMAEEAIIANVRIFLNSASLLTILKRCAAKSAYRFVGYRNITIRLKSGKPRDIASPVFLRAKPQRGVRGRKFKRRQGVLRHLALELLGMSHKISPALMEVCVSMAVLCPSFEVAANALRGFGINMNDHLLQNITMRIACLAKRDRVACCSGDEWKKPGLRILVSVDGGRIRERRVKRGRRKDGGKRQGYSTDWFEPRLLIITQFDNAGKKMRSINPILDGSCGSMDDFFALLKSHLAGINLDEASEIVFCADGGKGIWSRTEKLITELSLTHAKQILDYTHAKQNISIVETLIANALKLANKERKKLSSQIRDLLWAGDIHGIEGLVKERLTGKRKAPKAALKKLREYFGNHQKFQYQIFRENGLPTGSGSIESAIRRVINLRIKGSGLFWKKDHAESIILLRSLVLTGKLKQACQIIQEVARKMFDNNKIEDLHLCA